ncbi:MAG: hypothetical protein KZQ65_10290 [Candidatus Thiodiazotropha sp. (ex Gloverina cf. vestifex)]|nr:hypothetical protein [Candidatus Thiodiazotropha sp. (ex Gloverina cf. vestifex)]
MKHPTVSSESFNQPANSSPREANGCFNVIHQVSNAAIYIGIVTKITANESKSMTNEANNLAHGAKSLVKEEINIVRGEKSIVNGKEHPCV